MRNPHKHAELIKAWADGAKIQRFDSHTRLWVTTPSPSWAEENIYRIKPAEDKVLWGWARTDGTTSSFHADTKQAANLRLTFDGETGKLKSAEVI